MKKVKVSDDTIAKLVGDIHALTETVSVQARVIQQLEARLAVCEAGRDVVRTGRQKDWWNDPIVRFQGTAVRHERVERDAGEQSGVI